MVKPYQRIESLVCIACETCECERCNVEDIAKRIIDDVRADAIDEMFSKMDKLTVYYAGDKDGNAITPKMLVKEDVIKLLEQLKEKN